MQGKKKCQREVKYDDCVIACASLVEKFAGMLFALEPTCLAHSANLPIRLYSISYTLLHQAFPQAYPLNMRHTVLHIKLP